MEKQPYFLAEIKKYADPQRAIFDARYLKSRREHWGVSVPQCALLAKTFAKQLEPDELLSLAESLWMTDRYDPRICAAKLLSLRAVKPSKKLWKMLLRFLKSVDGWSLEDSLAHVAWKCLLADNTLLDDLETWTQNPNFWMRRAALVYTLPFAKQGQDPERMLGWASVYAQDPEWFIQKAIGWWLRVLGVHNPDRVILFLNNHWHELKPVAKKEATRKLPTAYQAPSNLLSTS